MNLIHFISATILRSTLIIRLIFQIGPIFEIILSTLCPLIRSSMYVLKPKNLQKLSTDQRLSASGY